VVDLSTSSAIIALSGTGFPRQLPAFPRALASSALFPCLDRWWAWSDLVGVEDPLLMGVVEPLGVRGGVKLLLQ